MNCEKKLQMNTSKRTLTEMFQKNVFGGNITSITDTNI